MSFALFVHQNKTCKDAKIQALETRRTNKCCVALLIMKNNQKSQPFFLNPFIPSLWNITRNVSQNSGQSLFL